MAFLKLKVEKIRSSVVKILIQKNQFLFPSKTKNKIEIKIKK